MIKALTAHTGEVDDVEAAVSEILGQLNPDGGLLKNSVGLLTCYAEFINSDAVREICRALPFEVVGSTTLCNATRGSSDKILLSLMVLTSDDVSFSVGLSAPLTLEDEDALKRGYDEAASRMGGKGTLMLCFAPLLVNVSGDFFANVFSKISGGVPVFGMIAVDHNSDYRESQVIRNGEAYADRAVFVLVDGSVSPKFYVGSISSERVFRQKGVVTASQGNHLQSVNNVPAVDYLLTLGLTKNDDGTISGINSFPFIVDYNDGSEPVVRATFAMTPDGSVVCGGDIPVGATLSVGSIDADEVLATTEEAVTAAVSSDEPSCLIMFSCVGRYFTMDYDPMGEIEKIQSILDKTGIPYNIAYSGGELCPVPVSNSEGGMANRGHNDTLVICSLR
ncbi:MAG: FIST C-terminal domain-containing protein [Synergistaceae bacterium]|nr:FIST C-terminal domain-containing protein [Synergistaceae bacterium]